MPLIKIQYDLPSRTFTATDEADNAANFQSVLPEGASLPVRGALSRSIRPMQGLLMSLGTCSGIDIVSILEKQRQDFSAFSLEVHGEREKDKVPALWIKAHVRFVLQGNVDADKAARAAALSMEKYCSVAETLRRAGCEISWDVELS